MTTPEVGFRCRRCLVGAHALPKTIVPCWMCDGFMEEGLVEALVGKLDPQQLAERARQAVEDYNRRNPGATLPRHAAGQYSLDEAAQISDTTRRST